jgi:hypothetical protein
MRSTALVLALLATGASAATLSGTVTGPGGAPVASAQVRLWVFTGKDFSFTAAGAQMTTTDGSGNYAFANVAPGQYVIDVQGGGFADRYYQNDGGSGYVDGTVITVVSGQDQGGLNITMDLSGGVDGLGTVGGGLSAGLQVVTELISDPRVNHNDTTQGGPHQGEFHMRGLPSGLYRIALHDISAQQADKLGAMSTVANGANGDDGTTDLPAAPADPYEPNNTQPMATSVSPTPLQQIPQIPYTTTGARIAPRNTGDVDWYCTSMRTGDRLVATAVGTLALETGGTHESPWVDPVMSLWRPDGTGTYQKVLENDDGAPGTQRGARVDTGELAQGGPMCVVVSTYGDTAYAGMNQGSAGDYQLTMKMGNRGPTVTATSADGGTFPAPPLMVTINEGDTFTATLTYSDPEHDMLSATWNLVSASNVVETQGSFNTLSGMSTFQWTADQTAMRDSPYTLTLTVSDGDIARVVTIIIQVLAVNVPPSVPVPLSPVDGGSVQTATPQLLCAESSDLDQETTTYEFELDYGDAGLAADGGVLPSQAASVVGTDGGWIDDGGVPPIVTYIATPIPENARVHWRVRAYDGHPANGHSPWSPYASFLVDQMNDPPLAPVITKPMNGDTMLAEMPTITVAPPIDPEGDAMQLFIEIAKDSMFTMNVDMSGAINATSMPTMWTTNVTLDFGATYYARAHAVDARGGVSPMSATVSFTVRNTLPPSIPPFVDPDSTACNMGYILSKPSSIVVGQSIDPAMLPVTVQLQIFLASEDPGTATPAFDQSRLQQGSSTVFDVSNTPIPMGLQHRARIRASDQYGPSGWGECLFTVGQPPVGDGGMGGGAGGGSAGTGGGGGTQTPGGCHCGSAEGLLAIAALALVRRRRRTA